MPIKLNSDASLVAEIREKIKANYGHCCCAIRFDDSNLCMCEDFRNQVTRREEGFCNCGLYEFILDENERKERK